MSDLACIVYLTVTLPLLAVFASFCRIGEDPVSMMGFVVL